MFNNAIDLAVLDWFHLFGYHNDDLHWKRIAHDIEAFRNGLYDYLEVSKDEWESYRDEIKEYRDKDVAHIEVRLVSNVPEMTIALKAVNYYYRFVLRELFNFSDYSSLPRDLIEYHKNSLKQTEDILSVAFNATRSIKKRVF